MRPSCVMALIPVWFPALASAQVTSPVSVHSDGTEGNDDTRGAALSGSGRYVAFDS